MRSDFPLPDTAWSETREFWAGAANGELRIPACRHCQRYQWYPQPECRHCQRTGSEWVTVSGHGRLFSWVVVTHPFLAQFRDKVPFVPALVSLDEDESVRLATEIVDADPDGLTFGLPVQVTFRSLRFAGVEGSVVAPLFTPTRQGGHEDQHRTRSAYRRSS
jgi:uncharacterized OB-fold protein